MARGSTSGSIVSLHAYKDGGDDKEFSPAGFLEHTVAESLTIASMRQLPASVTTSLA